MNKEAQNIFFHEVKNNLANIYSMVELIEDEPESFSEYAPLIKSSILNVKNIEKDYETYINTGIRSGKCQAASIDAIIESVCAEYKNMASEYNVAIQLDLTNIKLCIDIPKFKQVISNLLSNAIKYNVDGGVVMISLYYFNHKVRIEIKDNGIGMTQAEIKKLGTVFFRSKRKEVPGTGLGWATVVNICDLFGWKYFVNIADFTKTTTTKWKTTIVITI
jgi:signal transduction histidine kinase